MRIAVGPPQTRPRAIFEAPHRNYLGSGHHFIAERPGQRRPSPTFAGKEEEMATERRAVMTVPEVAELLGLAPWTVYHQIKSGLFPVEPIRIGRKILFAKSRIESWLGVRHEG